MAQKGVQLDEETFSCSICLDLLTEPVTTPCGHNYCMNCIKRHWDKEDKKRIHSCPQCMQVFTPRPVLLKNTMLAVLVEQLKKTGLQATPAGPEDVTCDVCTGRKQRACKSCLVCLVSYCEEHLQPHYDVAPLKKHKLVEPSEMRQENIRSHHGEVSTAPNVTREKLEEKRLIVQLRIQRAERYVRLLQQEVEAINRSADKAVEDSENDFTEMIRLLNKRRSDVKKQVTSQQRIEVSRVKELQMKLKNGIFSLKMINLELEEYQFPCGVPHLSPPRESTSSTNIRPLRYFEDVTAAVSEVRDKLYDVVGERLANISQTVSNVDIFLSQPQPKTRDDFLQYSHKITLNPNTAHTHLLLSEGNRKATMMSQQQSSSHQDRFRELPRVLSRESLTGRCYWEVEIRRGRVFVAVAYKNISRAGDFSDCVFGFNDKSWALDCDENKFSFWSKRIYTCVSGPRASRVGVYLDHCAGILSFYSVSKTMTLLHRVQTMFTQPLYAGLMFLRLDTTAELCKLK